MARADGGGSLAASDGSSMSTSTQPRMVDLLVVCSATTPGNRRSELELVTALSELGLDLAVASTDYGWVGRLPMSLNLIDLTHAVSLRLAVDRALKKVEPKAIIYGTGGAAYLEPVSRLARAAVRFDSLAAQNRPGLRHVTQRTLERRMVRRTALLVPWSSAESWPELVHCSHRLQITLPTPVEPSAPLVANREPVAVCYAGAPWKKGLDLVVEAWRLAALPEPYELVITGIDACEGRRWLSGRGLSEPPRVRWCGHLGASDYRHLVATASIYLAASRYEDYGIAQLEALADGALLVTTPSPGPYEALALARELDPDLVALDLRGPALAKVLREAHQLSEVERDAYHKRVSVLLRPYTRRAFRERLSTEVLPALFASVSRSP
jgi:hypothetical protein